MGCGSSTVGVVPGGSEQTSQDKSNSNNNANSQKPIANGVASTKSTQKKDAKTIDSNGNTVKLDQTPVPKAVAFDVSLDGQNTQLFLGKRGQPQRLQTLEPLDVPKLSAEQLVEKQKQAEEKREKLRQKRASTSKKSSRRRQELVRAKEFEAQQQEKALDDQQKQVELKREARLREIQEKQRIREERAERTREKAKKLNQGDAADDIDVEKDDYFNASDVDSWLGEDEVAEQASSEYSGPKKQVHSSIRPTASASTVDSYDTAFQRQPRKVSSLQENGFERDDEFFG